MAYVLFNKRIDYLDISSYSDGDDLGNGWIYHSNNLSAVPLAPGDIIRTGTPTNGHSAVVWKIENGFVKVVECLGNKNNVIKWGAWDGGYDGGDNTVAQLQAKATYIIKAPQPVKVSFAFRDGDNSAPDQDVIPGNTYGTVPSPTVPHDFETFIGWWDNPTIQNKEYNGNSIVTATTDHTLYAHWASTFEIMNVGANKALTISGSNVTSLTNNQNVILADYSGANTQKWLAKSLGTQRVVKSVIDINFGLNIYAPNSTKNCDVYPTCGNEGDALVDFVLQSDGTLKIKMRKYNLYLTAVSTGEGENLQWNVKWQAASNSNLQKWTATIL